MIEDDNNNIAEDIREKAIEKIDNKKNQKKKGVEEADGKQNTKESNKKRRAS